MNQNRQNGEFSHPLGLAALDKEQLSAKLQRLERLAELGLLSASAAHEIKNALVPVKTFVELLLEQNPASELAPVVRRELERINQLVTKMLRLARPNKSGVRIVSLHEVLDDSLRLILDCAEESEVQVEKSYTAAPDRVSGDPSQLEQVFLNLLLNAVEAMENGGKLAVKTELDTAVAPGSIRVTVSDTGSGISPADLKNLFTVFFTTKEDGTGLGLAIANDIVAEHGGTIAVDSQPGRGTSFTVTLPAAPGVPGL